MSVQSRRTWLQLAGAAAAALPLTEPAVAAPDYVGAKDALKAMITADPNIGPTMIRLAWHRRVRTFSWEGRPRPTPPHAIRLKWQQHVALPFTRTRHTR